MADLGRLPPEFSKLDVRFLIARYRDGLLGVTLPEPGGKEERGSGGERERTVTSIDGCVSKFPVTQSKLSNSLSALK